MKLNKLKLSAKLYLGFGVTIFLILVIAGTAILSVDRLQSSGEGFQSAADSSLFLVHKEVDHLNWINQVQDMFVNNRAELKVQLDETKCGLGKFLYGPEAKTLADSDPELAALLKEILEPHARLHKSGKLISEAWQMNHPGLALTLAKRLDDHRRWASSLSSSLLQNEPIKVQLDPAQCAFGKWLNGPEAKELMAQWPEFAALMDQVRAHHSALHHSAQEIKEAAGNEAQLRIYNDKTLPALTAVAEIFEKAESLEANLDQRKAQAHQVFIDQTLPALADTQVKLKGMIDHLNEVKSTSQKEMVQSGKLSTRTALTVAGIGLFLGIIIAIFLTRSITKPINRIIDGLNAGAEQVAAASSQVSGSSQSLAEGASEQAASLEETTSSMEEMGSMTKSNAENAAQADSLMAETKRTIDQAGQDMEEMAGSMGQIADAGGQISKIVKSIDEIAFQTNLLALNAAVEAARAGEAGMGFAVVADEVRSLAMRAAEAAKSTQALVEQTVSRINQGSDLVSKTQTGFKEITESAQKVASLVSEIAAASSEQSQGIDQVNIAMGQMDRVVQQSAANAEEGAAASEELSAQAENMKDIVNGLVVLITGSTDSRALAVPGNGSRGHKRTPPARSRVKELPHQQTHKEVTPVQAIPFDEDERDLAEF